MLGPFDAEPFRNTLAPAPAPAPAFSAEELTALPSANWITNGGSPFNQRYSPLTQINRFNVKELRALWKTEMGSGDQLKNGGQTQILHHEGTLFLANGINDVFAVDVETGAILWKHEGNTDPRSGNPTGWVSRGVALGQGMVFAATIDARLKALDQKTGAVVWEIVAEDWHKGFSITSAPLYYKGLVVTGFSGGELGVRQFLVAVFGAERPVQGRLGNHIQMQPVITLDEGGQSGKVRSRVLCSRCSPRCTSFPTTTPTR